MLSSLKNFHNYLTHLSSLASGVALATITGAYLYQVFMRYFLNSPSSWSNDVVSYLLIVMIFLALPKVTQESKHVTVTFLVEKLGKSAALLTHRSISALAGLVCFAACGISVSENSYQIANDIYTMGNHPIPKWWLSVFISYGLISTGLYFFRFMLSSNAHLKHETNDTSGVA